MSYPRTTDPEIENSRTYGVRPRLDGASDQRPSLTRHKLRLRTDTWSGRRESNSQLLLVRRQAVRRKPWSLLVFRDSVPQFVPQDPGRVRESKRLRGPRIDAHDATRLRRPFAGSGQSGKRIAPRGRPYAGSSGTQSAGRLQDPPRPPTAVRARRSSTRPIAPRPHPQGEPSPLVSDCRSSDNQVTG